MPDESGDQPPYGDAAAAPPVQPPPGQPPQPPPYGQSGASWPNSQPLPPTHSVPGQRPPHDPHASSAPPTVPGSPYGAGPLPPGSLPPGPLPPGPLPPGSLPPGPPGSHPYGPGGYGGPYIPPIPQRSNTGRTVAIVIGVVLLLMCGGCGIFGLALLNAGQDAIEDLDRYEPPVVDQTVVVSPGEAFLVGDFSVAAGWSVGTSGSLVTIDEMTTRKVGDAGFDTVAFDLTFYRGVRELGQATCSGTVTEQGGTAPVSCVVTDRKVRRADRVEVHSLL